MAASVETSRSERSIRAYTIGEEGGVPISITRRQHVRLGIALDRNKISRCATMGLAASVLFSAGWTYDLLRWMLTTPTEIAPLILIGYPDVGVRLLGMFVSGMAVTALCARLPLFRHKTVAAAGGLLGLVGVTLVVASQRFTPTADANVATRWWFYGVAAIAGLLVAASFRAAVRHPTT